MPSAASTHHSVGNAQRRVWEDDAHFSDALLLPERKTRPQFTLLGAGGHFLQACEGKQGEAGPGGAGSHADGGDVRCAEAGAGL